MEIRKHIKSIVYFEGIGEDELTYITENTQLRTFSANEIIFLEGKPAEGLWIVEKGNVKIFKLNPDGGEHILHLRGSGKTFNDIGTLDGRNNPANASALSIVRLARFLLKQAEDPSLSGPGVTRTAIAAHINTTPQTICNVLHSLEEMGAIQFDRHRIIIVNHNILRSIAML